jgi:hypothetical protein
MKKIALIILFFAIIPSLSFADESKLTEPQTPKDDLKKRIEEKEKLRAEKMDEIPVTKIQSPPPEKEPNPISFFMFYNFATWMNLSNLNAYLNGDLITGTGQNGTTGSYGIGFQKDFEHLNFGIQYDTGRSTNSSSVTLNGVTSTQSGLNSAMSSFVVPYFNGRFDFGKISIFAGFNYNLPQVSNPVGSMIGGLGEQAGITLNLTEKIAVDGLYQVMNGTGANNYNGIAENYNWSIAGAMVKLRVGF